MALPRYTLSQILSGHTDDVKALASSSSSGTTTLYSASRDGTVRAWSRGAGAGEAHEGEWAQDKVYEGHKGFVNAVAVLDSPEPSENLLVSGDIDGLLLLHDPARTDKPLHVLSEHWANVCALDVDPARGLIISGSWDKTARVWAREEGGEWAQVRRLEGAGEAVWAVKVLPDEGGFLAGSADKLIRHYSTAGELLRTFSSHSDAVRALVLLDSDRFASASNDATIRKWSLSSGEELSTLSGHSSYIYALAVLTSPSPSSSSSPNEDYLISSGEDYEVRIWLGETCLQTLYLPAVSLWSLAVLPSAGASPTGDVALAGSDKKIYVLTSAPERAAEGETLDAWSEWQESLPMRQTGRNAPPALPAQTLELELDTADDAPNLLFTYTRGTDFEAAAREFVQQHELPESYVGRIAQFVRGALEEGREGEAEAEAEVEVEGKGEGKEEDGEEKKKDEEEKVDQDDKAEQEEKKPSRPAWDEYEGFATDEDSNAGSSDVGSKPFEATLKGVAELIKSGKVKKIMIMAGAGISTAAGIPDFRSPETGLYANLQTYGLPYPEAIFEIGYFSRKPEPFYTLAKELYPGRFLPTMTHYFFVLLEKKGLLQRVFTQNIDTLERIAGLPAERIVEAHGSFATARCIRCKRLADADWVRQCVERAEVPRCREKCKGRKDALVKPDIVFFGEGLPDLFFQRLSDFAQADLLIVLGTSLKVHPFASLIAHVPPRCPRVLFNLEPAGEEGPGGFDFFREGGRDVVVLGEADDGVLKLADSLGWKDELVELYETERERKTREFGMEGAAKEQPKLSADEELEKIAEQLEKVSVGLK